MARQRHMVFYLRKFFIFGLVALIVLGLQPATVRAQPAESDQPWLFPFYSDEESCQAGGTPTINTGDSGASLLANATKPSTPFTGPTITPTAIILHWTAGQYDNDPEDIMRVLRNREGGGRQVQLYVNDQGTVFQLTQSLETKPIQTMSDAWNNVSIGIEIESVDSPPATIDDNENALMNNAVQYQSVLSIVRELMARYSIQNTADTNTKRGVFGHYEVNAGNSDPGTRYMAKIRADLAAAPPTTANTNVTTMVSNLIPEAQELLEGSLPTIEQLKPAYEQVAQATNVPWQALATLHYREANLSMTNPNNGEGVFGLTSYTNRNGDFPPGPINNDQLAEQMTIAVEYLKSLAKDNYDIDVSTSTTIDEFKNAFLAYNRGGSYKNHGLSADDSPYVMNYYDSGRINMRFPDSPAEPASTRGKVHRMLGAIPMMIGLGFVAGAGSPSGVCGVTGGLGVSPDGFYFPLRITKAELDATAIGWCKNNCHGSMWGGSVTYYAYDIGGIPHVTQVIAARGGTVRALGGSSVQRSVTIEGDDGNWYFYQHLDPAGALPAEGDVVTAGQPIGVVGPNAINAASGGNTAPHLHFTVSSERILSMSRGCSRSSCPNADKMLDALPALLAAYETLPE